MTWNQFLFLWLNQACTALPDWLWASLTITGHTSVLFALFSPLLIRNRKIITALFISAALGGIVSTVVKEALQIPRPPAILSPTQFHLIGDKLELVSFPSGHSLAAFTAATLLILGLRIRGWRRIGALGLASLIGLSRIAVGAHWPLDVLGGALLGALCGATGWWMTQKLYLKRVWPQSNIYHLCQSIIVLLVCASLTNTNMGYPAAIIWQWIVALFGVIFAVYSLYPRLNSTKIN